MKECCGMDAKQIALEKQKLKETAYAYCKATGQNVSGYKHGHQEYFNGSLFYACSNDVDTCYQRLVGADQSLA